VPRSRVLHSRTRIRRYRLHRTPFSRFALLDLFSALPSSWVLIWHFALLDTFWALTSASGLIFAFCAPGHVFDGTECGLSRFALPDPFPKVPRHSSGVFKFCVPGHFSSGPVSRFTPPKTFLALPSALELVFTSCAPRRVFGVTGCVGTRFRVLRFGTYFRRCRVRRDPFLRFLLPDLF